VLSPYLFAVYIDSVYQKAAAKGAGCYFKGICFRILVYADDIILLAPSVSALQHLLDVCESELQYLDVYQRQQIGMYQGWLASCTSKQASIFMHSPVVTYLLRIVGEDRAY